MQEYHNLVKSGESSDLGTAIQNLINDNLRFINTAFLAKIVKINTNSVDIQPILKQNISDKDLIINNCLIAFNHSQLWDIQHKLKVGDIGIALVMQNDTTNHSRNSFCQASKNNHICTTRIITICRNFICRQSNCSNICSSWFNIN